MLKIAVASDKGNVTEHFGHCESFMVYDTQGKDISEESILANPGHKPGFLPRFLHEKGVDVIISGGMGASAVSIFNENDIEVIIGAKGEAREAAKAYLRGELSSTGSVCHGHDE
ncbi:MAG: dinitrogenase iron-molybdenum cofactor [Tissierellia bacterium]|nr:dinitrogenase iron-molybdenum cofactor [Tissierellia bacterium]